jgi:RimJ/RimL family protein N-acetyltransferase
MIKLDNIVLRMPEPADIESLYAYRNDWEVIRSLGGFSAGYSRLNLEEWIQRHSNRGDEIVWTIAERTTGRCLGHAGLYQIDHRIGKAEFAIVIGDRSCWGKGIGTRVTQAVVTWGFSQLNLHKITLGVLANNARAIHIYEKLGFRTEGVLHDEQYRDGGYLDLIVMAVFAGDWARMQTKE